MPRDIVAPLQVGFFGKLPARGDFVRYGLPRDFTDPWDSWLLTVMRATKFAAPEAWLPAFLESPVWRFALPDGLCGARAVIGLMMPSVDRAGRYFPLTFAAITNGRAEQNPAADTWLDRCEDAGRDALEYDEAPAAIAARLGLPDLVRADDMPDRLSVWWTEGSPRVPAGRMTYRGLPDSAAYGAMLGLVDQGVTASRGGSVT